jgi:hypothetical protein
MKNEWDRWMEKQIKAAQKEIEKGKAWKPRVVVPKNFSTKIKPSAKIYKRNKSNDFS